MAETPTILCITRAYPPVVGGMERLSFEFTQALADKTRVTLVANRLGKKALPFFLPWAALRIRQRAPRVDVIHLGDPLLTVLLPFIGPIGLRRQPARRPPVAATVHGLDILYPHPLYQALLRRFLPRVDLALCISRFVETECRKRFPTVRTAVITPGLLHPVPPRPADRPLLEQKIGASLRPGPLLLSVARLVPRKGMRWFVDQVLPSLPDTHLLVLGDGPEHAAILAAARARGVAHRVTLVGSVADDVLHLAYRTADLFVMPNIPVPGDAEGFGLVALEAASAGLPVLAADLEGLRDAIAPKETGCLLPPGDAGAWTRAVRNALTDAAWRATVRAEAPRTTRERFTWEDRARAAAELFLGLAERARGTPGLVNKS